MQGIIHLEKIIKSYFLGKQELRVLKSIDLDVYKNEYVALMGPSGSGKNVIDLANIYSCSFIATEDAGKLYSDSSFEVLGRLDNTDIRGCSLLAL
jgi:ABC-type lipoprotein export system ATPase subunit